MCVWCVPGCTSVTTTNDKETFVSIFFRNSEAVAFKSLYRYVRAHITIVVDSVKLVFRVLQMQCNVL